MSFAILIDGAFLVFTAILRLAGIFDLQIICRKLLIAKLTDISVICTTEKSSADVVQIRAPCHNDPPFFQTVFYQYAVILIVFL